MARSGVNPLAFAKSYGAGAAPAGCAGGVSAGLAGGLPDPVGGRGGSGGVGQVVGQLLGSPCRLLPAGGRRRCPPGSERRSRGSAY